MEEKEILENLAKVIIEGDSQLAKESAQLALSGGLDPLTAVERGLSKGMQVIGANFESGDAFLPELLMAAEAFTAAMEIIKPAIEDSRREIKKECRVVLATVKGDVHNIGKNIVATVMETNGFEVTDIGIDRPTLSIIEAAENNKADIIALSSVMTTTMPYQREIIETLTEMKLRDRYVVLVGGGPVSQKWADEIGADGYGRTAVDAVTVARRCLRKRQ